MVCNPRHILRGFNGIMPTHEPEKILGLTGKRKIWKCRVVGYDLYTVDGKHIRSQWADFIGGSHHLVNQFIPKTEIWLDATVRGEWPGYLASHELLEALLMQLRGWTYDRAHTAANGLEQGLRGTAEHNSLSGPKIAEIWGHHLRELFPKGDDVQVVADTVARQFWRFL